MYEEIQSIVEIKEASKKEIDKNIVNYLEDSEYEKCPECGKKGLTHIGGCDECIYCGWSRCS